MIATLSDFPALTNADQRQRSSDVDLPRAEAAVRELLLAIGEDPNREGLRDTPRRVARMYREIFAGLRSDPAEHLARTFDEPYDEIVALRDIDFTSMCEHHLLPFVGRVHIAYLPSNRVVGLSKLARTVDTFARRPQVQERLTTQIADAIAVHLDARGVIVVVESEHFCMKIRGVKKSSSTMVTQAARGVFIDDATARHEALMLLRGKA
ncbi:MAG: GTP cyclohydrolase I FolE [Phycisphaerae bacterium]